MNNNLSSVIKTLSGREKTAGIVWLIIGILQCLSCIFIIVGICNIVAAASRFKQSKAVLTPWRGIVNSYDKWLTKIIINIVVNAIFGGIIGIIGCIYDLVAIRGYVLSNKQVFEAANL